MNLLIEAAESGTPGGPHEGGGVLLPPAILTPGSLLERVHLSYAEAASGTTVLAAASPLARQLAWSMALAGLSRDAREAVVGGMAFEDDEPLAMASLVLRSHDRLASHLLTFEHALERAGSTHNGSFEPRLSALAQAQARYEQILHDAGLEDAALSLARLVPGRGSRPAADLPWHHLVLVGVADIPSPLRRRLGDLASAGHSITALVFAPEDHADRFDEVGGVVSRAWQHAPLDLRGAGITVVDGPDDLVDAALAAVAGLPRGTTTSDVVLGVTDEGLTPTLVRRGARCGVRVRAASAGEMARAPAVVLLRSVVELLREPTFREWGTLIRHPWVERALVERLGGRAGEGGPPLEREVWLSALDRYVLDHLPNRLSRQFVEDADAEALLAVLDATLALLGDLAPSLDSSRADRAGRRPLSEWARVIGECVGRVAPPESPDDRVAEAQGLALEAALHECGSLASSLDQEASADEAIALVLERAMEATLGPLEIEGAVEAVGWLELPMDPAEHVVVIGMNEGAVPSREATDPLLPAALLRVLGVDVPSDRLARDAYLLSLLSHSRRTLFLGLARAGRDGEPNLPSRLLFHTDDATLRERARLWSPKPGHVPPTVPRPPERAVLERSAFEARRVPIAGVPDRWRVTAFRDYLASPYLFYLKHVARVVELETVAPDAGGGDQQQHHNTPGRRNARHPPERRPATAPANRRRPAARHPAGSS